MAAKKGGLGKGLDSLMPNKVNTRQLNQGISQDPAEKEPVKTGKIVPGRAKPRSAQEKIQ